ncbi:uncharacterized protein LOC130757545 isoform X1 [Actinidia eriantha]|uniref:uncharacterized protein LOC130757545 isoform X1 n=1 Tax=Actinidia eriantha TaxID=165200 RepID=UPI00258661E6|nr:uncharacterized protein LOC130757545 isoform X1 [Actinidia eriantha]
MDLSENDYKLENTQMAESQEVDDLVRENLNCEKNSKPVEEFPLELDSEKLEEEKVDLDPIRENEPFVLLSEETKNPDENGVYTALLDYVSKEMDSLCENGVSSILSNTVSEGNAPVLDKENDVSCVMIGSVSNGTEETIFPASEGNPEESSGVVDLVSNKIEANATQSKDVRGVQVDKGGEDSKNMPEIPQSTENQVYIAVTPRPQQRTSWIDCCGLFEVLKRSVLISHFINGAS